MKAKFYLFSMALMVLLTLSPTLEASRQSGLEKQHRWRRVFLPSFPRSGNHWCRALVEEASGIATSSVKRDRNPKHDTQPFPWGGYCPFHGYDGTRRYAEEGEIVLIKTHFPASKQASKFDGLPYEAVVRLIRHPVDSFYSEYIRRLRQEPPQEKVPRELIEELIVLWIRFHKYWNEQPKVINIRYEDLLTNTEDNLKIILDTLQYKVKKSDIKRAVAKNQPEGFVLKHKDKFEVEDLELIERKLKKYMIQFGYTMDGA